MLARGLAVGAAIWTALSAAPIASARAETLRASYAISLVGLPVGVADLTATITGDKYSLETHARISGIASLVTDWRNASTGSGALAAGRVSPATFATTASNASMTRTIRMALQGNAVSAVDIAPPFEIKADVVPVTAQDKQGVVDPVGAMLMPLPSGSPVASPAACNRTLPIFDGATRFDIALAYVGERKVKTKGYSGPVAVCAARYTPIAGYRRDRPNTKFWQENKDLELWLAPVGASGMLMPYRVSIRTPVGAAVLEANEFRVEGK